MPFLVPALASCLSDVLILVVQEQREEGREFLSQLLKRGLNVTVDVSGSVVAFPTNVDEDETSRSSFVGVHNVQYLALFAVMRLLLLLFPLPYHSYTGTAIRFPFCYSFFYCVTLLVVLFHMLALIMIDPDSLSSLVPGSGVGFGDSAAVTVWEQLSRGCWWILLLSLVSAIAHIVMLIHVRSTAPSESYIPYHQYRNGKRRKLVYFFATSRQTMMGGPTRTSHTKTNANANTAATAIENENRESENENETTLPTTPPARRFHRGGEGESPGPTSPIQKLSSQYDDFVTEMQSRISTLKRDWTNKLDDFTQRHLNMGLPQHQQHNNPLLPLTPFRVLLQLFAYQDVIETGKLDAVFEMDQGESLTFFVPQLLSFLLHGAYYETDPTKLEAWILDKCHRHVHFAHRCFWFLQAWSLEQHYQQLAPAETLLTPTQSGSLPVLANITSGQANSTRLPEMRSQNHSRSNSSSSLTTGRSNVNLNANTSFNAINTSKTNRTKLLPEERAVVENLMLRVALRGEEAARLRMYGPLQHHLNNKDLSHGTSEYSKKPSKRRGKRDQAMARSMVLIEAATARGSNVVTAKTRAATESTGLFWDDDDATRSSTDDTAFCGSPTCTLAPELVLTPEMEASLPVDPRTGFPSHRHLEAIVTSHRYGFMPLTTAKKQRELQEEVDEQQAAMSAAVDHTFHATPRFLDALLAIADGLFLVPKDQRQKQLQLQLQALEVELLPNNAIYVPISNTSHRVWRIVVDESLALNTKERVPCIILLEVVDYKEDSFVGDATNQKPAVVEASINRNVEVGLDASCDGLRRKRERTRLELPKLELPKLGMSKGPKMRKHQLGAGRESWEAGLTSSSSGTASTSSPFFLPYYTMMGGMTETEIIHHWRFARRDPHRGESILDKMSSSLPLDMNRMKQRIHLLRDKQEAVFHDLFPMTSPDDSFSRETGTNSAGSRTKDTILDREHDTSTVDGDSEIAAFLCNDPDESTRTLRNVGSEANLQDKGGTNRDMSPERLALDGSLGQWTSPTTCDRAGINLSDLDVAAGLATCGQEDVNVRTEWKRLETAYGSTYEGRGPGSVADTNGRPPRLPTRAGELGNVNGKNVANAVDLHGVVRKPPQQVVFRENWQAKEARLRPKSAFGSNRGWRLLPVLVKANDDLRQEQLASQIIHRMAFILARERVPVWLCPYDIIALTGRGGIIEAIPDTISLDSLKRNDPNFIDLRAFFHSYFGGNVDELADAKSNFVESLAGYSIVTFLLQVKDRHNGNILLDNRGHLIHIDFGFFFLSSPGKNTGFESAPFKLTRDFVEVLGGPESHSFRTFRELCVRSFLVLRRHCMEIILLVEMLKSGNEDLSCFRGRPDDAIQGLRERFRLDLSDRACREYVQSLIDESLENWRTNWYDRYQRYCVGVL